MDSNAPTVQSSTFQFAAGIEHAPAAEQDTHQPAMTDMHLENGRVNYDAGQETQHESLTQTVVLRAVPAILLRPD